MLFRDAIHVGELVTFSAAVNYTGRTSMEIGIRVDTVDPRIGVERHTNSCYFTMISVDADGVPVEVPPLQPTGAVTVRRNDNARHRRRAQRHQFEGDHACEPT